MTRQGPDGPRARLRRAALVVGLVLLGTYGMGVRGVEQAQSEASDAVVLAIGESARLDAGTVVVSFVAVRDDSRCPVDARCIRAGSATVVLRVRPSTEPDERAEELEIRVPPGGEAAARWRDHTVSVTALQPQTETGREIAQNEYRASVRVAAASPE